MSPCTQYTQTAKMARSHHGCAPPPTDSSASTAPMLPAMIPITRPKAPPAMSENPAVTSIAPTMIVIQPHVWRFVNTYCVPLTKRALLAAPMP